MFPPPQPREPPAPPARNDDPDLAEVERFILNLPHNQRNPDNPDIPMDQQPGSSGESRTTTCPAYSTHPPESREGYTQWRTKNLLLEFDSSRHPPPAIRGLRKLLQVHPSSTGSRVKKIGRNSVHLRSPYLCRPNSHRFEPGSSPRVIHSQQWPSHSWRHLGSSTRLITDGLPKKIPIPHRSMGRLCCSETCVAARCRPKDVLSRTGSPTGKDLRR